MRVFEVLGVAGLVIAASLFGSPQSRPAPALGAPEPVAIGIYEIRPVLEAYYASPGFKVKMKALHEAHAEAKGRGDTDKMKELERQGEALQERAHQQYDGEAPIPEVLEVLRPAFPEIAKAAGVGAIVADFVWRDPGLKTVDLTPRLVERLKAPRK